MFNNKTIDSHGEEVQMQIRYADTQEQKHLKQSVHAARQFRSAECKSEASCVSQTSADSREDEYATSAWRQGHLPYVGTTLNEVPNPPTASTEFDQYLGTTAGVPIQNQRWAQQRAFPARQPYMSQGPSSQLHATNTAGVKSNHGRSASETTIEADKPSSPSHDSANGDHIE